MWFRGDLRIADNPALLAASGAGSPVLPVFIYDETAAVRPIGGAARWWLDKSLKALGADLRALGAKLVLRRGAALQVLHDLVAETGAREVVWNRLYDPGSVTRDREIKEILSAQGVACRSFNAGLLNEPWEVKTGAGGPFKVFSAFWRQGEPRAAESEPLPKPKSLFPFGPDVAADELEAWALHPTAPDWSQGFRDWAPGESGALLQLQKFLGNGLEHYGTGRDRPDQNWTSRLSPHLRFGEIGPRQAWAAAREAGALGADRRAVQTFQKELGWREFNYHLLFNFPQTLSQNLNPRFDGFPWRSAPNDFAAWREGRTGFPIVDAGMRQLWATGWMHNRVRMIAASFLIKDLLIDWRDGEAWFWDTLVDADIASNVGGWQWVAGSGADAAPYFRVFNPVLQGEKFDPDGAYVRRWAPELKHLPSAAIHAPWRADPESLRRAEVRLGETYPLPIVDHAEARDRALEIYKGLS
jgi:deoxyribodipyrimidine photo-lyase